MTTTIKENDAVTLAGQTGHVVAIRTDIGNAAKMALVSLESGTTTTVPVSELKLAVAA